MRSCPLCHKSLEGRHGNARFCSPHCKGRYNRLEKLEKYRQYDRDRHLKNPEATKLRNSIFRSKNPDYGVKWYQVNKETHCERTRKRHKEVYVPRLPNHHPDSVRGKARAEGLRSGFERTLAAQIKRAGVKFDYEPIALPFVIKRKYFPDFYIPSKNMYIEAKGKLDADTKAKMIAVKEAHPDLDIRFVFMRGENKLSKRSKTTYLMWAEKNGFPAADGEIPEEWLK